MSEENNQPVEFSSSLTAVNDQIIVEFADGARPVPDYVIRGLGGADKLSAIAAGLKTTTYENFLTAFRRTIEKRDLNNFQARFIANHFGNNY